ncbi:hypothetical protein NBH00_04175 [Paraconexibacter antarcticus]|uniref:Uncharacterized protein n=1 Tax=Paraconexibacter antarcticus TaxID=2949664 RepID=A0ABY5DWV1_9ACTN|nr:hypothetical protein [Paraconexibacter antarcticus]UTI65414.1 hypothetical protein NBH00_04175 [Paraconexibacter antarcticus]
MRALLAPPLAVGTLGLVIGLIGVIVAATAVNIVRLRKDKNATFLEWDPVDRAGWHRELDEADVHLMLAEHNARRARDGLRPETMEEYAEAVRRRQA